MYKSTESLREVIHKKKNQKENNKTTGQYDKLKGYQQNDESSIGKLPTDDKQIRREAKYIKNIHLDSTYERLRTAGLVTDDKYKAWWFKSLHTLGVVFVDAQAHQALTHGKNPAGLFHFLINKAMNKANDPHMPRFNDPR